MTSYLRKSVALGPYEAANAETNFGFAAPFFDDTHTGYVRLWVNWRSLAPYAPNMDGSVAYPPSDYRPLPGSPGPTPGESGTVADYVSQIDAQVRYARIKKLKVVMTFWQFPYWANGFSDAGPGKLAATPNVDPNTYDPANRRKLSGEYKSLYFKPPSDVTVGSYWAGYLFFLMARYAMVNQAYNQGAYVDYLEICNEPNLQWFPQQDSAGARVAHITAGRMMAAARSIQAALKITSPVVLGPATSDTPRANGGDRLVTDGQTFTYDVLGYLGATGFVPGAGFGWSHHNYDDIQRGTATLRTTDVLDALKRNQWAGWPRGDVNNSYIACTEGGYVLGKPGTTLDEQAGRLAVIYVRLHNDTPSLGQGVAMLTQYLFWTDLTYDCGLVEPSAKGSTPRPAYTVWKNLPTT